MYCPNCKQEFPGKFCPECGTKLVEVPKQNDFGVNISDDAAIMGGVNVTRNESHNTTNYDHRVINTSNVTNNIVERQKTDAELRNERNIKFMELCKEVFKDGLLDEEDKRMLTTERIRLGIDETEAARLIEMARKSSVTRMTTLGMRDAMTLKSIDRYIESNNTSVLETQLSRLVALANSYKLDEVFCKYNMLLAALRPDELIREYETNAADEYWQTYWAAIAYMKRGNIVEAEKAIVKLDLYPEYSEDNSLLLSAVSTYCEFGADDASDYISAILPEHCSSLLMPFIHALFLVVSPERAEEVGADKQKCQFYIDNFINIGTKKKEAEDAFNEAEEYFYALNGKRLDYSKAVKLYSKAAEFGYAAAQYMLAECMSDELGGLEYDEDKIFELYSAAAEQGYAKAMFEVGECYGDGIGVDEDEDEQKKWYEKAVEAGSGDAAKCLADYYNYELEADGEEEEAENNAKAMQWYQKAAELYRNDAHRGDLEAMPSLADLLQDIIENGHDEGTEWRIKFAELCDEAIKRGDAKAMYLFAKETCYKVEALAYYLSSALQGYTPAKEKLKRQKLNKLYFTSLRMECNVEKSNWGTKFDKKEITYEVYEAKCNECNNKLKLIMSLTKRADDFVKMLSEADSVSDYKKSLEMFDELKKDSETLGIEIDDAFR